MSQKISKIKSCYATKKYKLIFLLFLGFLALSCAIAIAQDYGSWMLLLIVGLPSALLPIVLVYTKQGLLVNKIAVVIGLMFLAALYIQQTHGMKDAQFAVFILLAPTLY